jgi:hypothetical protein
MLFFPQDHRYHEYHISDHVILSFEPCHSSDNLHGSECRTDECHGRSSIQEYDTIWNFKFTIWNLKFKLERDRDFYHAISESRDLKTICSMEGESGP